MEEENKVVVEEAMEVNEEPSKNDDYVMKLPDSEKEEKKGEPNVKPAWMMRLASGLIDICILILSIFGLNFLLSKTGLGKMQSNYRTEMILVQDEYKLKPLIEGSDATYGHKVYENEEDYTTYTTRGYVVHDDEETKYVVVNNENISSELVTAFNKAVTSDEHYKNLSFDYRFLSYGITMISCSIGQVVFFLAIPLFNKKRATIGMLLAGTQLIYSKYPANARWYHVLIRFFFILLIESALGYLVMDVYVLAVIPVLEFIITLFNKKGRNLHDYISRTMVIDKRSFSPIDEQ